MTWIDIALGIIAAGFIWYIAIPLAVIAVAASLYGIACLWKWINGHRS